MIFTFDFAKITFIYYINRISFEQGAFQFVAQIEMHPLNKYPSLRGVFNLIEEAIRRYFFLDCFVATLLAMMCLQQFFSEIFVH